MDHDDLRVTYRRTGGIAGIEMAAECGGTDLPEDQAAVASGLLADSAAGMPGAPDGGAAPGAAARSRDADGEAGAAAEPAWSPGGGADQFTYTLEVVRGEHRRTVTWSDTTVPDQARPLLTTLGGMAQPTRGS